MPLAETRYTGQQSFLPPFFQMWVYKFFFARISHESRFVPLTFKIVAPSLVYGHYTRCCWPRVLVLVSRQLLDDLGVGFVVAKMVLLTSLILQVNRRHPRHLQLGIGRISLYRCFTDCMPLLAATVAFGSWTRRWSSRRRCYLHFFRIFLVLMSYCNESTSTLGRS